MCLSQKERGHLQYTIPSHNSNMKVPVNVSVSSVENSWQLGFAISIHPIGDFFHVESLGSYDNEGHQSGPLNIVTTGVSAQVSPPYWPVVKQIVLIRSQ